MPMIDTHLNSDQTWVQQRDFHNSPVEHLAQSKCLWVPFFQSLIPWTGWANIKWQLRIKKARGTIFPVWPTLNKRAWWVFLDMGAQRIHISRPTRNFNFTENALHFIFPPWINQGINVSHLGGGGGYNSPAHIGSLFQSSCISRHTSIQLFICTVSNVYFIFCANRSAANCTSNADRQYLICL